MKDELKKLARQLREASKALSAATHQAGQAAATLADKRAELAAVKESNQELQDQHIQETQVRMYAVTAAHLGTWGAQAWLCCKP